MKKFIAGLIVGLLLATVFTVSAAQPIRLIINDSEVDCDVPPQIINGRTMVPARYVAEPLGATVEWDAANNAVAVTGKPIPDDTVEQLGYDLIVNEELVNDDYPPSYLINHDVFIPLELLKGELGSWFDIDDENMVIAIQQNSRDDGEDAPNSVTEISLEGVEVPNDFEKNDAFNPKTLFCGCIRVDIVSCKAVYTDNPFPGENPNLRPLEPGFKRAYVHVEYKNNAHEKRTVTDRITLLTENNGSYNAPVIKNEQFYELMDNDGRLNPNDSIILLYKAVLPIGCKLSYITA